jgi:N-acetylmuramic acid 6-phosphate etherase
MVRRLYDQLGNLTTEAVNPRSARLDRLATEDILSLINDEDQRVAVAVRKVLPQVNMAVEMAIATFRSGGRLIYAGAGTSGRLGVLDAAECPPTFGVNPSMVRGIIAGGRRTLVRSREGVEDDRRSAESEVDKLEVGKDDVVIGIAASARTPYPLAALKRAHGRGAHTILLVCNELRDPPSYVDLVINPILGPEVLTGSTRMKAGTACKMILNMITTASMVQLGKCYRNLMVDLKATSAKLAERSRRILVEVTGVSYRQAGSLLKRAHGKVKTAIVMQVRGTNYAEAEKLLRAAHGMLYRVIE